MPIEQRIELPNIGKVASQTPEAAAKKLRNISGISAEDQKRFKDVSEADWNSWKWQLRNAIRDVETLEKVIPFADVVAQQFRLRQGLLRIAAYPPTVLIRRYARNIGIGHQAFGQQGDRAQIFHGMIR